MITAITKHGLDIDIHSSRNEALGGYQLITGRSVDITDARRSIIG